MTSSRERRPYMREYNRRPSVAQSRARRRERARAMANAARRRPCSICGGTFPVVAMDLHHRDPATKSAAIATIVSRGPSVARMQAELDKCDPVCANCHRIHHWGGDDD